MERSQSTFEAYDGVELHFGAHVVRTPAFTTAEATHFIRLLSKLAAGDGEPVERLVREFVERVGLRDVRLVDLGVELDGPDGPIDFGDLTAGDAQDMLQILHDACWNDDILARSKAQVRWLDEVPTTLGLDASRMEPAKVFDVGRNFAEAYYLQMYGLASDFCSRLHQSPPVKTWTLRAPKRTNTNPSTSAAGMPT